MANIADMKAGGQNEAIGNDPVYLPQIAHILPQLYNGGYSAVIDASKFFCQFPTHPQDQPYLGVVHPGDDNRLLYYGGLPMGAGNSPSHANCSLSPRLNLSEPTVILCRFNKVGPIGKRGKTLPTTYLPRLSHPHCTDGCEDQPRDGSRLSQATPSWDFAIIHDGWTRRNIGLWNISTSCSKRQTGVTFTANSAYIRL